jgi:hypothetical protein
VRLLTLLLASLIDALAFARGTMIDAAWTARMRIRAARPLGRLRALEERSYEQQAEIWRLQSRLAELDQQVMLDDFRVALLEIPEEALDEATAENAQVEGGYPNDWTPEEIEASERTAREWHERIWNDMQRERMNSFQPHPSQFDVLLRDELNRLGKE